MAAYYNEIDPYAAQWLRNLIAAGLIAPGDVDERSIVDVRPDDLAGYDQCHFFAGIGGWSRALRLAGWRDERPVWTGSCPCQPFSAAGKRKGVADERHLWPEFRRLIAERSPPVVFGEQVASADGRDWLAGVRADLEDMAYAVGAADLCAAGVGAPHIRQRLWWVGHTDSERPPTGRIAASATRQGRAAIADGGIGRLADAMRDGAEHESADGHIAEGTPVGLDGCASWAGAEPRIGGAFGGVVDADDAGPQGRDQLRHGADERAARAAGGAGFWSDFDLLPCTDGKARRVEPGTFPLAHGVPNRVGRLRAYGNAIVPAVAAEFIAAFREAA